MFSVLEIFVKKQKTEVYHICTVTVVIAYSYIYCVYSMFIFLRRPHMPLETIQKSITIHFLVIST